MCPVLVKTEILKRISETTGHRKFVLIGSKSEDVKQKAIQICNRWKCIQKIISGAFKIMNS